MLSILKRGTCQVGSTTWEFHQDNDNPNIIYITPIPQFAVNDNGVPRIQILTYQTSDPTTNGSGFVQFVVELGVPPQVLPAVTTAVQQLFGVSSPIFQTLPTQAGTSVQVNYPDGQGGTTGLQFDACDFASNTATIQLPLTKDQMNQIVGQMAKVGGSPFQIEYAVVVPSFMPAVTMQLSFNSSTAFTYQVTAFAHSKWNQSTTYTYDITKQLSLSNAATVTVNKVDPNTPQDVIDRLNTWGQQVIGDRVAEQVQAATALENNASGTVSFEASSLTSFSEWYAQNETIPWRLNPQGLLPSFGDLALTQAQIQALSPTVDDRQFTITVTPNVKFSVPTPPPQGITPSANSFVDNLVAVKSLIVTVNYPSLQSSASKTFTFTTNNPNTWTATWDNTAMGVCSISYTANYTNGQTVTGTLDQVDVTQIALALDDIGTMHVMLDATGFFNVPAPAMGAGTNPDPSNKASVASLNVNFVFDVPNEAPFVQSYLLNAANPTQAITSPFAVPLSGTYYYTITYNFKPGVSVNPDFTTDVKMGSGYLVRINGPVVTQAIPLLAFMKDLIECDLNVYYEEQPVFPPQNPSAAALPAPTQSSPIQFSISGPDGQSAIARREFAIFSNSNTAPLLLNASAVDNDGNQIQWGPIALSPQAATLLSFNPKNTFTFVEFDPSIVDWKIDNTGVPGLTQINVVVNSVATTNAGAPIKGTVSSTTQSIAWVASERSAPKAFYLVTGLGQAFDSISITWTAEYVYREGVKTTKGTQSGTTVELPKTAS